MDFTTFVPRAGGTAGWSPGLVGARGVFAASPFIEDFDDEPAAAVPATTCGATAIATEAIPAEAADPVVAPPVPDLAALREAAFAQGQVQGRAQAEAEQRSAASMTLEAIGAQLRDAALEAVRAADAAADQTARLLLSMLCAMMPALCARHGAADAEALVRSVLPALRHEPVVTIRVSPHVRDAVAAELARSPAEEGPEVRLVATDAMAPGDARVSWRDGIATRSVATLWREVLEQLAPLGPLEIPPAALAAVTASSRTETVEHV